MVRSRCRLRYMPSTLPILASLKRGFRVVRIDFYSMRVFELLSHLLSNYRLLPPSSSRLPTSNTAIVSTTFNPFWSKIPACSIVFAELLITWVMWKGLLKVKKIQQKGNYLEIEWHRCRPRTFAPVPKLPFHSQSQMLPFRLLWSFSFFPQSDMLSSSISADYFL